MKKRIISIFLIVSIIVSLFAISAVNTSAYSKYASAPTLTSVTTKGYSLHVSWSHNGYATQFYTVWAHKWGTDATKSKNWVKFTSFDKSINIQCLQSGATYDIKVSAHDEMGNESKYSNVIKRTFVCKPTLEKTAYYKKVSSIKTEYEFAFCNFADATPDYYVFWLQYKSNSGNKWSNWQQKVCYSKANSYTYNKMTFQNGYTYRVKVSAVMGGYHSDYSNTYSVTMPN